MKTIEFLGQARAGKTTQIQRLKEHLVQHGYKVALVLDRERAQEVHAPVEECLAFNLVFHGKVIDAYYKALRENADFFLVDRGFCDVTIWAEVLWRMKTISAAERDAYATCWQRFRTKVDLVFYFNLPLDFLFERQKELNREEVDDVVMNHVWMKTLGEVYEQQRHSFPHGVEIDGRKSIEDQAKMITTEVKKLL